MPTTLYLLKPYKNYSNIKKSHLTHNNTLRKQLKKLKLKIYMNLNVFTSKRSVIYIFYSCLSQELQQIKLSTDVEGN